jgi:hypothetical protein
MKFDFRKFSGVLAIGHYDRHHIWCSQTQVHGERIMRNAGKMLKSVDRSTLLAAALFSSLRAVSNKSAEKLIAKSGRAKPYLHVKSIDPTFFTSLPNLLKSADNSRLWSGLAHQLNRFQLFFDTEAENPAILNLQKWAEAMLLIDPSEDVPALHVVNALGDQVETGVGVRF